MYYEIYNICEDWSSRRTKEQLEQPPAEQLEVSADFLKTVKTAETKHPPPNQVSLHSCSWTSSAVNVNTVLSAGLITQWVKNTDIDPFPLIHHYLIPLYLLPTCASILPHPSILSTSSW